MNSTKKNIAIFGDISMNGIDGSSIWLQSLASIFPKKHFNIYLILRDRIESRLLIDEIPNVNIIDSFSTVYLNKNNKNPCSPYEIFNILNNLNKAIGLDHIILRAPRFVKYFIDKVDNPAYKNILSKSDLYFAKVDTYNYDYDREIIEKGKNYISRIIVQTEEMRSFVEFNVPDLVGRVIVLNPMIPNFGKVKPRTKDKLKKPILIYAGKLDGQYHVEDFLNLLSLSNSNSYELMYIGSKFNSSKTDKGFVERLKTKLSDAENCPNFTWIRQLDRRGTLQEISQATFMLSLRQDVYDTSNEISTKLLEAMSVGTLPLLKMTAANVKLIGADYPGFVKKIEDIPSIVERLTLDSKLYNFWARTLHEKAREYNFTRTYNERLAHFYEPKILRGEASLPKKKKILIASHDNKFLTQIIDQLQKDESLEVRFDDWNTTLRHDGKKSEELLKWADIILCEWAVGAAVYYSQNKLPHQRVLIRLHRFEITTNQPDLIEINNVEKIIVVSDYIKKHCIEHYKWSSDKIRTIPQYADTTLFNRPKIPMSEYSLGLLGMVPSLKRLDKALDIIEHLRRLDERYVLYIKSKQPWDIPFIWNKESEKEYFIEQLKRIEDSRLLREGVVFDDYGADVAAWFRKIGWMLSTSDIEGCHTAVAEGMASGAKPVIFNWPGAEGVYKEEIIFKDPVEAATHIYHNGKIDEKVTSRLKAYAKENFDLNITEKFYYDFLFKENKLGSCDE